MSGSGLARGAALWRGLPGGLARGSAPRRSGAIAFGWSAFYGLLSARRTGGSPSARGQSSVPYGVSHATTVAEGKPFPRRTRYSAPLSQPQNQKLPNYTATSLMPGPLLPPPRGGAKRNVTQPGPARLSQYGSFGYPKTKHWGSETRSVVGLHRRHLRRRRDCTVCCPFEWTTIVFSYLYDNGRIFRPSV